MLAATLFHPLSQLGLGAVFIAAVYRLEPAAVDGGAPSPAITADRQKADRAIPRLPHQASV
jgi:hypothetical protein